MGRITIEELSNLSDYLDNYIDREETEEERD